MPGVGRRLRGVAARVTHLIADLTQENDPAVTNIAAPGLAADPACVGAVDVARAAAVEV